MRGPSLQSEALGAVFSGAAGGYLAGLGPLIGEVAGVAPAAITFDRSNGSLRAEVAGTLSMRSEEAKGMDGATAPRDGDLDAQLLRQLTHWGISCGFRLLDEQCL